MQKLPLSFLVSALLAQGLAWAAPVNPLVRPAALAGRSAPAPGGLGNLPTPPMPGYSGAPGGYVGQGGEVARATSLPNYTVVVIAGESAVLRVLAPTAAPSAVAAQPVYAGMPNYQPQASSGSTSASVSVSSSLIVKHKQRLQVGEQELLAEVANGQVTLKAADTDRVVFTGRVDGASQRPARTITPEAQDMGYVGRQTARSTPAAGGLAGAAVGAPGFGVR